MTAESLVRIKLDLLQVEIFMINVGCALNQ